MSRVVADVQNVAREHSTEAIETLARIMRDPKTPPAARISAACALLDRGYGKPSQAIEATNPNVTYVVPARYSPARNSRPNSPTSGDDEAQAGR